MYSIVKTNAVLRVADSLLQANNTVTTLEIKQKLLTDPATSDLYWDQQIVHDIMDQAFSQGKFKIVQDNGTYRTYESTTTPTTLQRKGRGKAKAAQAATPIVAMPIPTPVATKRGRGRPRKDGSTSPTPKVSKGHSYISRKKALELMQNNKGHFFTATFVKKDSTPRTINCQYLKDQTTSTLGYVKVKEAGSMKKGVDAVKQVNLQTLKELKIAGAFYKIR